MAQRVKHLPAMQETQVRSLVRDDPLEKEMATHSSVPAWRIPWMEDPVRLQSTGSQRVGYDFTSLITHKTVSGPNTNTFIQPIIVLPIFSLAHNLLQKYKNVFWSKCLGSSDARMYLEKKKIKSLGWYHSNHVCINIHFDWNIILITYRLYFKKRKSLWISSKVLNSSYIPTF